MFRQYLDNFRDILLRHQSDEAYLTLQPTFDRLGIYEVINRAIDRLEIAVKDAKDQVLGPPISLISSISSNLLVSINRKLEPIDQVETKRTIQGHASTLAIKIILNLVQQFPKSAVKILDAVNESLQTTAELFDYDIQIIENLLPIEQFSQFAETLSAGRPEKTEKKSPSLVWNDRVNIGLLSWELKNLNWIKTQKQFCQLFEKAGFQDVEFDLDKKYELAYLLFRLREEQFIKTTGNRGYFSIAEKRIIGMNGETLTPNSLKKMSSKISLQNHKYRAVVEVVDQIIQNIE